jgi:uncharacterized RDD family membrane protein YckC
MMSNEPFTRQPADQTPGWTRRPTPGAVTPAASADKRVGAFIIDSIGLAIVAAILVAVTRRGGDAETVNTGLGYVGIVATVIFMTYFGLIETGSGQTLGKKLLHIKAVSADGSPLPAQAAFVRRLPFAIGIVIPTGIGVLVCFVVVLMILITALQDEPEHRGFHDKWAGSKVVDA